MIGSIQSDLSILLDFFGLSLEQFDEDINHFHLLNYELQTKRPISARQVVQLLLPFGNSIELNLRHIILASLSGDSDEEDLAFFDDLIKQAIGQTVSLSIVIDKETFITKRFPHSKQPIRLFFNPTKFAPYISPTNYATAICNKEKHTHIVFPFWNIGKIPGHYASLCGNQLEQLAEEKELADLQDRLESQKLYCNSGTIVNDCLPDHFYYRDIKANDDYKLLKLFNNALIRTVMHFIANNSANEVYLVQGFKNIKIQNIIDPMLPNIIEAENFLYQMYVSIYSSQVQDKLLITRNVISLHLPPDCTLTDLIRSIQEIFYSVDTNYDSFIKDKIKSYFEKKRDLEKHVRDTSESISKQIASVSDNLSKSWLALAGAILTAVVAYSSKGGSVITAAFFVVFGGISFFVLHQSVWIAKKEMNLLHQSYTNFLRLIDGINEIEKRRVTGTVINDKFVMLRTFIGRLSAIKWLVLVIALALAAFMFSFADLDSTKSNTIDTSTRSEQKQ